MTQPSMTREIQMRTPERVADYRRRSSAIMAVVTGMAMAVTGCLGDRGTAPSPDPARMTIGTVAASPINAVMAVGGTLQLGVTGRSLSGTPIAQSDFDSVMYYMPNLGDTLRVRLTPGGQVTALASTGYQNPVLIYVIPFKNGSAKEDMVTIQITDNAIAGVSRLSIHPVPPDSAKLAQASYKFFTPVIENSVTHEQVDNPTLRLTIKPEDQPNALTWISGAAPPTLDYNQLIQYNDDLCCGTWNFLLAKANTGSAWIYASANVYGTVLQDSVLFTFSPRYEIEISIANVYGTFAIRGNGNTAGYVAPGGTVDISNGLTARLNLPITITFDNPAAALPVSPGADSGNVVDLPPSATTYRKFVTPGTYHWTATVGGSLPPFTGQSTYGTIVVQP